MSIFQKYSAFYDLLYRDKDYVAEAEYVATLIRSVAPNAQSILDLGSGTGRHGRLLAAMGFEVLGIERSQKMVTLAQVSEDDLSRTGSFTCQVGNICQLDLGRTFDAVISLFHVMSYQIHDHDLRAAFQVASNHLHTQGLFVFDVWHGPAVLSQRPSDRVKAVADDKYRVTRTARPKMDLSRNTVNVMYELNCENLCTGVVDSFREDHLMRYLFPAEIHALTRRCGLEIVGTEEFLTRQVPSSLSWSVVYLSKKLRQPRLETC